MTKLTMETIAKVISEMTGEKTRVERIYLDFGANIIGNNIIVGDEDTSYQLLNFREIEEIDKGIYTLEDVQRNIDRVNELKVTTKILKNR